MMRDTTTIGENMSDEVLLAWTDTETTGLIPGVDKILEVAVIVTNLDLEPPASWAGRKFGYPRFERVIGHPNLENLRNMSTPYVYAMHEKNGLWADVEASVETAKYVDTNLAEWLASIALAAGGPELRIAGNSVHFDLGFMKRDLPTTASLFSHRIVDNTSNQFFVEKIAGLEVPDIGKPEGENAPHRAMQDVHWSLEQALNLREVLHAYR